MTLRDKLIAGGTDLESVDAVLRNGDMSVEPDKVPIDAEGDSQMSLRDYFAAHAPEIPVWFHRETTAFDSNDPAGLITRWAETEEQHMVRWRWHYADAMLAGDDAAIAKATGKAP